MCTANLCSSLFTVQFIATWHLLQLALLCFVNPFTDSGFVFKSITYRSLIYLENKEKKQQKRLRGRRANWNALARQVRCNWWFHSRNVHFPNVHETSERKSIQKKEHLKKRCTGMETQRERKRGGAKRWGNSIRMRP